MLPWSVQVVLEFCQCLMVLDCCILAKSSYVRQLLSLWNLIFPPFTEFLLVFLLIIRHFQVLLVNYLPLGELNLNIKDYETQSVQRGSFIEIMIKSVASGVGPTQFSSQFVILWLLSKCLHFLCPSFLIWKLEITVPTHGTVVKMKWVNLCKTLLIVPETSHYLIIIISY